MGKKLSISMFALLLCTLLALGFASDKQADGPRSKDPRAVELAQKNRDAGFVIRQNLVADFVPTPSAPLSVINESFEGVTFPPVGWTKLNPDGGTGWNQQADGTTPVPGWGGGNITTPPGGGTKVAFCTWNTGGAVGNDQFIVTPQITNVQTNDSLKFWLRYWPDSYRDSIEVLISTTTPVAANFTTVVMRKNFAFGGGDTNWTEYKFRIGNLVSAGANIYIGFREVVADNLADGSSFSLDLVSTTGAAVTNDIAGTAFINPVNGGTVPLSSSFSPQASFSNLGSAAQTNVPVRYRILNSSFVEIYNQTTLIASINPGQTLTATFPSTSIGTAGSYMIKARSELVGDQVPANDSIAGSIGVGSTLAGDYTIGAALFNSITGKNITFDRVVTKVMKEVYEPVELQDNNRGLDRDENSFASTQFKVVYKEVEEVTVVPMSNGVRYEGSLFASRKDYPNLSPDAGVGVYATITSAVSALNTFGVSASVRFLLLDANYGGSETFPITINAFSGASSVNTVTIRPQTGVTSTITSAATTGAFKLNGADWVRLDGSNSGGTDRSLSIVSTSTAGLAVWVASASASNGATNNIIKNCNMSGVSGITTIGGILTGSGTTVGGDAESPNSNLTIQNNNINKFQNAAYVRGNSTTLDSNMVIIGNTFGSTTPADRLGFRGMLIGNSKNFTIANNDIKGVYSSTTATATTHGIQLALNLNTGSVNANKMSEIHQINTGGWGAAGITFGAATTASGVTVSNNFIWDVRGEGFAGVAAADNGYGLMVVSGGGYNIYYNSVSMNVNQTAAGSITAAMNVSSAIVTANSLNVRDNIFSNTQTVGTNRYAVYSGAASTVYADINYNDYYYGASPNLGFIGGLNRANLAAWQAGTTKDANSVSGDPLFVSATDLHITSGASAASNTATPIAGITTDIDGNTRSVTTPDMGGDEFSIGQVLTLKISFQAYPTADTIRVLLRNSTFPYAVVDSVNGMGGGALALPITFSAAANGVPYYIVVRYRNGIETWSSGTPSFVSNAASYDFTTALSQAYLSNQVIPSVGPMAGIPSIYQGDVNQSANVNLADVLLVTNDAAAFVTGPYLNTDFNGSGTVNLADILIASNNNTNFVVRKRP